MRKIRGKEISMIFQEPMTALDPMYTIEEQIEETLRFHTDMNRAQMHDAALEMLQQASRFPVRRRSSRIIRTTCPAACSSA